MKEIIIVWDGKMFTLTDEQSRHLVRELNIFLTDERFHSFQIELISKEKPKEPWQENPDSWRNTDEGPEE